MRDVMLPAGLRLVVDDAPRLTVAAADRVLSEVDDERRRKAVAVLKKALRNHRKKDRKRGCQTEGDGERTVSGNADAGSSEQPVCRRSAQLHMAEAVDEEASKSTL